MSPGALGTNYTREGGFRYQVTDLLRPFQATSNLIGTRFVMSFVTAGAMTISEADLAARAREYADDRLDE